jgi:cysteinyl-tRNA synthetase
LNKAVDKEFIDILSNDLDFPNAIKHIWTQAKSISTLLQNKQFDQLLNIISYIKNELDLLGIIYNSPINDKIESLLNQMKLHLKNKDFKKSDEIRDQLIKMGLI